MAILMDSPFSSDLDPTKIRDYSTKSTTKVFRATIFGIRNDTVEKMPAGWSTNDVVDLDWFKELIDKPTDILDNF